MGFRRNMLAYSVRQTAGLIGMSLEGTYEAIRRKEIPSVRVGKRILVPRIALEHWLGHGWADYEERRNANAGN